MKFSSRLPGSGGGAWPHWLRRWGCLSQGRTAKLVRALARATELGGWAVWIRTPSVDLAAPDVDLMSPSMVALAMV